MGVCTTRQWQTSGRLVQELNVSTVLISSLENTVYPITYDAEEHVAYSTDGISLTC